MPFGFVTVPLGLFFLFAFARQATLIEQCSKVRQRKRASGLSAFPDFLDVDTRAAGAGA